MRNWIPQPLHGDLSPLLVQAGLWPSFRDLSPVPGPEADETPDPAARRALFDALSLVHERLRGPRARRLYWTQDRKLYYRLVPPDPEGDPLPQDEWLGWLSWEPCAAPVRALALYARLKTARGPATLETLDELLGELLAPDLMDELRRGAPHPAPAVGGPDNLAAIYRLDPAGFGSAWSYLYTYTNGARVVAALQPLVHMSVDA